MMISKPLRKREKAAMKKVIGQKFGLYPLLSLLYYKFAKVFGQ